MQINFLLLYYGMERFDAGIVIRVSLTAEGMYHLLPGQIAFKCLACVLAYQITVEDNLFRVPYIQSGVFIAFTARSAVMDVP